MKPAQLLEQNLDRVVDSVLRSLQPGRSAEAEGTPPVEDEATTRRIMADLCGHVAVALRGLDEAPRRQVPPSAGR
jgi:hypothetical protein